MRKVYIVTSGEYSDYGIDSVFSTEEKAKEWIDVITSMYDGSYNIEPYELDAPIPERKEYLLERLTMLFVFLSAKMSLTILSYLKRNFLNMLNY